MITKRDTKYDRNLNQAIFQALDNAVKENGYTELKGWSVERIVSDLRDCCGDPLVQNAIDNEIFMHVERWLKENGNG